MAGYSITIQATGDEQWTIDQPRDGTVGEALEALTMHLCYLSQSIEREPEVVMGEVLRMIHDPKSHIHQEF